MSISSRYIYSYFDKHVNKLWLTVVSASRLPRFRKHRERSCKYDVTRGFTDVSRPFYHLHLSQSSELFIYLSNGTVFFQSDEIATKYLTNFQEKSRSRGMFFLDCNMEDFVVYHKYFLNKIELIYI